MRFSFGTSKNIILIASTVLLTAVMVLVFVAPSMRDIMKLRDGITAEREKLEDQLSSGKTLKKALETYDEVKDQQALLDGALLTKGEELEFITSIEQKAESKGLDVDLDFNTDLLAVDESGSAAQEIPLSITLTGKYINVLFFLEELEKDTTYLLIKEINIASLGGTRSVGSPGGIRVPVVTVTGTDEERGDVRASLKLHSYWQ